MCRLANYLINFLNRGLAQQPTSDSRHFQSSGEHPGHNAEGALTKKTGAAAPVVISLTFLNQAQACFLRRAAAPIKTKPVSIMREVPGSGTVDAKRKVNSLPSNWVGSTE